MVRNEEIRSIGARTGMGSVNSQTKESEVEQVPEIREALQELSIRVNQTQGAQTNLLDKLQSVISQAPEIASLDERDKEGSRYSCPLAQELWELSQTLANVTEIYMEKTRKIQL